MHELEGQLQEAESHQSFLQLQLQERLAYHDKMEVTIIGLVRKLKKKAESEACKWKEECTKQQKHLERLNGQCTSQIVDIQDSSVEIIRTKEELLNMKTLMEAYQQALAISQAEHDKMKQVSDTKSNELDCINAKYFALMEDKVFGMSFLSKMNVLQKEKVSPLGSAQSVLREQALVQTIALLEQEILSQQSYLSWFFQACHELSISRKPRYKQS